MSTDDVYFWLDHACIDQGSWCHHANIGMGYVYALPFFLACCEEFVFIPHDRENGRNKQLRYYNRGWCRIELVVAWAVSVLGISGRASGEFKPWMMKVSLTAAPPPALTLLPPSARQVRLRRRVRPWRGGSWHPQARGIGGRDAQRRGQAAGGARGEDLPLR